MMMWMLELSYVARQINIDIIHTCDFTWPMDVVTCTFERRSTICRQDDQFMDYWLIKCGHTFKKEFDVRFSTIIDLMYQHQSILNEFLREKEIRKYFFGFLQNNDKQTANLWFTSAPTTSQKHSSVKLCYSALENHNVF